MITIFSSAGCPFAQRTRALLHLLEQPYEVREVDLENRDPELLELSPTGKVPFLVDGDVRLFESSVINDYLAEKFDYGRAYSSDLEMRAMQRLVMRRWDDVVVPAFYASLWRPSDLDGPRRDELARELAFIASVVERRENDVDGLVALHVATHWARIDWLRELTPIAALVDEYPVLRRWLDRAVARESIQSTLPSRAEFVDRHARRLSATAKEE